jgi:hypothetical protein
MSVVQIADMQQMEKEAREFASGKSGRKERATLCFRNEANEKQVVGKEPTWIATSK